MGRVSVVRCRPLRARRFRIRWIRIGRTISHAPFDAAFDGGHIHLLEVRSQIERMKKSAEVGTLIATLMRQQTIRSTFDCRQSDPSASPVVPGARVTAVLAIITEDEDFFGADHVRRRERSRSNSVETE